MKNTQKKLTTIAIALIMALAFLVMGLGGIAVKAFADDGEEIDGYNSVFYFSDYYPTLRESEINKCLSDGDDEEGEEDKYHTNYQRWLISEELFYEMINLNFFSRFNEHDIVAIDIKTFLPDSDMLLTLFSDLKSQDCITIFVSSYEEVEYNSAPFFKYVDKFIHDDFTRLKAFAINTWLDFFGKNKPFENTAIFIDGNLVDTETYFGADINLLCESSPFLRILLDKFAEEINDPDVDLNSYEEIVEYFNDYRHNIKLLVCVDENTFIDILTWDKYKSPVLILVDDLSQNGTNFFCCMGFWRPKRPLSTLLHQVHDCLGRENVPCYMMEVDPFVYDPNGLAIITDGELIKNYGNYYSYPEDTLLDCTLAWMEVEL